MWKAQPGPQERRRVGGGRTKKRSPNCLERQKTPDVEVETFPEEEVVAKVEGDEQKQVGAVDTDNLVMKPDDLRGSCGT